MSFLMLLSNPITRGPEIAGRIAEETYGLDHIKNSVSVQMNGEGITRGK